MEEQQILQQIEWLEEKRKQDSQRIERLQERLNEITGQVEGVEKKFSGVPVEITRLSEKVARINQLDDALVKQREDIARQLQEFHDKRDKRDKQKEALADKTKEYIQKDIEALQGQIEQLRAGLEKSNLWEREERRLSEAVGELRTQLAGIQQQVEEALHKNAVVEERRKHDLRRISEMSADMASVQDRHEKHLVFQENMETRARRIEDQLHKMTSREGERREELDLWMQQQQGRLLDYERSWKDWVKKFEAFDEKADTVEERIRSYQETYLELKQVGQELTDLMDMLERRVTEIAEMQRLSEDRVKKELNVFLADDQKRWNMFKLTHDEQWREHERLHEKLEVKVEEAESVVDKISQAQKKSERFTRKMILDLLAVVRDWASELDN